jgi:peptide/nickel transport system substrate-binding protein
VYELKNVVVVFLLLNLALSGCARRGDGGSTQTTTTTTTTTTTSSSAQPAAPGLIITSPNPGPFKVVDVKQPDGSTAEYLQARGEVGDFGGTLRLSTFGGDPKTFNPWVASDVESGGICYMMFDKLVDTDVWTGKPYPRLAKTVSISPDNKVYTVTLRRGLVWSDGKPITADDVVYTFGTIVAKGYGNSSLRDTLSVYGKYPAVEKVDDLTVRFTTSVPFSPFLNSLTNVPIAPKHVIEPFINSHKRDDFYAYWGKNSDPKTLVVSGRLKLARYVPGQRLEFVRNDKYHMVDAKGQQLPYLDKFILSIVPDQNTQLLKFMAQEVDFLDIRSVRGADAAKLKQQEKTRNFTMRNLGPDDGTMFFMVNMCRRKNPKNGKDYVPAAKQKWFNNVYFRQAISHAIDRQGIVDNVLRGVGLPLYTPESTASIWYNKNLQGYPQDFAISKDLLKKGGFVLKDDKLYDADNNRVEFNLLTNAGNTTRDAVCVMIKNDLQKLGMKVNYQPIDFNILIDKTETSLDWEAIVMGLSGSKIEPYDGANVWKSNGRLHMFDQRLPNENGSVIVSDARDWETRIDELFDQGATTFDEAKRHACYDEYQKIAYEQMPFTYLYSMLDITAMRNTIGNYKPTSIVFYTPLGSLHNLEEIFVRGKTPASTH